MTASPELRLRIGSALILVAIAVAATLAGGVAFKALWFLAAFACWSEWIAISLGRIDARQLALGVIPLSAMVLLPEIGLVPVLMLAVLSVLASAFLAHGPGRLYPPGGLAYCGAMMSAMIVLRQSPDDGVRVVFWLFAIVWTSDIAAFFTGRTLGGPKIMPRISPKKTWSGFIGGTIGGAILGSVTLVAFGTMLQWQHVVIALLLSVVSAMGDLGESAFKRRFGVKDSGRLVPGHGGLLDRLDGFMAVSICAALIGYARNSDPATGLLAW